jgi:hypothetical protein
MNCIHCNQLVTDDNAGQLCPWHLDLEVLAETLQERRQPVTLESLTALIRLGLSRGGSFVIVPDDLPSLITPALAEKYGIVEAVTQ